ncbi:MAG: PD-(D/E)XK nuclease family protein [Cyclobacteriaceae bacterium]
MEVTELKKAYLKLVGDIRFDLLELIKEDVSFFEIVGASKAEIRHSNFLAWLLDPDASHGLAESILKRFLRELFSDSRATDLTEVEVEQLNYSSVRVLREWNNIDLLIEFDNVVIALENKILSREHSNQLTRYFKIVEREFRDKRRVFGFLTPTGHEAESESSNYVAISYQSIYSIIERVVEIRGRSLGDNIKVYITDYLKTLKRHVMETDEAIDLAKDIYKSHKEIIDFIIENRPDEKEPIIEMFREKLKNKGYLIGSKNKWYLRFNTKKTLELLPSYANQTGGWPDKEPFLFEFSFWSEKYILFAAVVSPGEISDSIRDVIMKLPNVKSPSGKKWFTFFHTKMSISYDSLENYSKKELSAKIDQFLDKLNPIINEVESILLENSEDLPTYEH